MSFVFGKDEQEDRLHCIDSDIFYCEPGNPWSEDRGKKAFHPFAREVGDQEDGYPGGDIVRIECPICNHSWRTELPQ